MARFSFALIGQDANQLIAGLAVKLKDENSGTFVASTSPTAGQLQIVDNNDGTYYCDDLPDGLYSVYSNDVVQAELQNIPFVADDTLAHIKDPAPHSGHTTDAEFSNHTDDSSIHRTINDGGTANTDLWSGQKINSELEGKADSNHEHSYVKSANSEDFEVDANGDLRLKDRATGFTEQNYVKDLWSIFKNLDYLDQVLKTISEQVGGVSYRTIFSESEIERTASGAAPAFSSYEGDTTERTKIRVSFYKLPGDTRLILRGFVTVT